MNPRIAVALLLLGLAVAQALPSPKLEQDAEELNNKLHLEEAAEDKERSKKSVILGGLSLIPQAQTVSIQAAPALQTFSIQPAAIETVQTVIQPSPALQAMPAVSIQAAAQPVQTVSIQPAAPAVSIQTAAVQPIQALNLVQAPSAILPQATVISEQVQPLAASAALIPDAWQPGLGYAAAAPLDLVQPAAAAVAAYPQAGVSYIQNAPAAAAALNLAQPLAYPQAGVSYIQNGPAAPLDLVQSAAYPQASVSYIQSAPAAAAAAPLDLAQPLAYPQASVSYVSSGPAVDQVQVLSQPRQVIETVTKEEIIQPIWAGDQLLLGPQVAGWGYQPQAIASSGLLLDDSLPLVRERTLVDTVQKANIVGGRVVETVRSKVY